MHSKSLSQNGPYPPGYRKDVTCLLPQASIEAMHKAIDELANKETFHGYGPNKVMIS